MKIKIYVLVRMLNGLPHSVSFYGDESQALIALEHWKQSEYNHDSSGSQIFTEEIILGGVN